MAGLYRLKPPSGGLHRLREVAPPLMRILRLSVTRYFGTSATVAAAAQPQLDPDYYYYYYCDEDSHQNVHESPLRRRPISAEEEDSEVSVPPRGVQWVFIGSPGAKKHVYAEKLSRLLQVPHISMGSLVRQDLSPRSLLYKQIADAVNRGTLVPEEIIFGLLSKRLEDGHNRGETGFILNGIPRTQFQAEILDQLVNIDLVLNFKCPEDCLLQHYGNSVFSHCHEPVSDGTSTSTRLDKSSEHTQLKYRASNNKGTWNEKVHVYSNQMKPLEDYYKKQKKLLDFEVGSTPGETWQGLLAALHLQHIKALHSELP